MAMVSSAVCGGTVATRVTGIRTPAWLSVDNARLRISRSTSHCELAGHLIEIW
ncbi:hypothetical protein MAJHIDBO_02185 [Propionibacterium freudenreichii subsp. shermanii]|nr:hypothetical protein MAJHIDBO_02185 [Propionibacterium freudenreichii subsp. shermanii]SPS09966.1 hypothetical protein MAJHIDBO_02185 [Propionibacterium freudenreichii subsp. shermanii]